MARYHFNPETGLTGQCDAEIQCPFGDNESDHYATEPQARQAYEATQNTFGAPMRHLNSRGLRIAILREAQLPVHSMAMLEDALDFANHLHRNQCRKSIINGRSNTPYIEHPYRNTLRLIRLGVNDAEVLMATVLHDTVEDCAEEFCDERGLHYDSAEEARRHLAAYIGYAFGKSTLSIVLGVTNPLEHADYANLEEKQAAYRRHAIEGIHQNVRVFLVKTADVLDNAGSLHHSQPHELPRALKQAAKYSPMLPVFVAAIDKYEAMLGPVDRDAMRRKLEKTIVRLELMLKNS